jgi:hypothetical protein
VGRGAPGRRAGAPGKSAASDGLLRDPEFGPLFVARWQSEMEATGRRVIGEGCSTIPMRTYVRLMVLKTRNGRGCRSLAAEVSDSIYLRRFCRISLVARVPDESTVRKLTRRIGAATVEELSRALIEERRFRPRAV